MQANDDNKLDEEEGQNKVIPKWKASHITQIIIDPEVEEEEEEPKAAEGEEEEEGEASGTPQPEQQEGGRSPSYPFWNFYFSWLSLHQALLEPGFLAITSVCDNFQISFFSLHEYMYYGHLWNGFI